MAARRKAAGGGVHLHLDTFSGMAGNMFLGALLDAGLSRRALAADLTGLGVEHRLRVRRVRRGALAALHVAVGVPRKGGRGQDHDRGHARHHGHGRRYAEIRRLLARARLAPAVRERAQSIFAALAEAEARVHDVPLAKVHFHEVGAVDAIVDVAGAAIAVERLGVERITATPVALGHGSVETEHGRLPLPAPATLELLRGIPTVPAHVEWETLTPTGAAILRTLVDEFRPLPALTVEAVGHGAGNDRPGPLPNVVRAVLGRTSGAGFDRVVALEANLDDLVPEHFDHAMARLLEDGALDVSLQHVQTKKNRPGFLIRVLSRPEDRERLAARLFAETTTLGVRLVESDRILLPRLVHRVRTPYGSIRVKTAWGLDGRARHAPEYDDCRRLARRADVPIASVVRAAEQGARELEARGALKKPH